MRNIKPPALLLTLLLCMTLLAAPASAYSGGGEALPNRVNTSWAEESEPVTGGVEVTETGEIVEPVRSTKALTPEGNLTLVDDISDNSSVGKQFLTVTTRNGHYFYLIVDRARSGENTVHFLNQVDESDLLSIIEEKEAAPAVCTCSDKCYPGHVDTSCPVCAVNMTECAGKEALPEQTDAPETQTKPERSGVRSAIHPIPTVIALAVVVVGGAVYFLKFRNPKPDAKGSADLDDYDYGDEDEPEDDAEESEDA